MKQMKTHEYGNPLARTVLIQPVDEQDLSLIENEVEEIARLSKKDFHLITFKINNWNQELSPWTSPAVFGKNGFGDGLHIRRMFFRP
jgi:hypothetical protein